MPRAKKGVVQIRFEILEYLYYNPEPQPKTHIWRKATTLSYDDFLKHLANLRDRGLSPRMRMGTLASRKRGGRSSTSSGGSCPPSFRIHQW